MNGLLSVITKENGQREILQLNYLFILTDSDSNNGGREKESQQINCKLAAL